MELRHLRYFEAVAETLHFGKAADRLHVTQPALSKQVKELEEELGVLLFIRYKKSIALTDAGKVFLEETRKTLQQVERSIHQTRLVRNGEVGLLRVGYDISTLPTLVTPLLRTWQQEWPGVKVILQEGCNQTLSTALREEALEVAFTFGPITSSELSYQSLYTVQDVLVLPAQHPLAKEPVVALSQLAGEPLILFPRAENAGAYDQLVALCQQHGFAPKVVHENPSQLARISMVGAGLGITFTVDSMQAQAHTGVVFKPIWEEMPHFSVVLAWKRSRQKPLVKKFIDTVKKQQASLPARQPEGKLVHQEV